MNTSIFKRINWRQPKYMIPAIVYIPLLFTGYFIIDMFHTDKLETVDTSLKTTHDINAEMPGAKIKDGDGIGSKYENMTKAWGKIGDLSAVESIDRDNPDENKEQYESKYTQDDLALLDQQEKDKQMAAQNADAQASEKAALQELEKALAEARLKGQQAVVPTLPNNQTDASAEEDNDKQVNEKGKVDESKSAVKKPSENEQAAEVVKKVKTNSDYFNTLTQNETEPKLIKAIIDENVKASDGSRVRLRLLDDVEIGDMVVKRGTYLYATMSGFSSQRVKGSISSILVGDELVKVNLSLYDTDGMEGFYVPSSQFRETTKDVASGAVTGNMDMSTSTSSGSSLSQWASQAVQNAYQKTSSAIGKAIKKNKVKLKYGTFVYIVNSKDINKTK